MQHFANNAFDAFREALGFLTFARADVTANLPAARTLKLKTNKTTTKTV